MNDGELNLQGKQWIIISKDKETDVIQSPDLSVEDALGMLGAAKIRYETTYKIKLEMQNIEVMKTLVDGLLTSIGDIAKSVQAMESATIKIAAVSHNILKDTQR